MVLLGPCKDLAVITDAEVSKLYWVYQKSLYFLPAPDTAKQGLLKDYYNETDKQTMDDAYHHCR